MARPTNTDLILQNALSSTDPPTTTMADSLITLLFKKAYNIIYKGSVAYSATPTDSIIDTEAVYSVVIGRASEIIGQMIWGWKLSPQTGRYGDFAHAGINSIFPVMDFSAEEKRQLNNTRLFYSSGTQGSDDQ